MAFTHNVTRAYRDSSGNQLTKVEVVTNNSERTYSESIADSTTNHALALDIDVSTMISLCLNSDRAVTFKTNSTSSPDDTIVLATGGQCVVWTLAGDGSGKNPLTADVTTIYITNASGGPAQVDIRVLLDSTP